jgi:glycosyltransferase involved in cell wall biosynthesis
MNSVFHNLFVSAPNHDQEGGLYFFIDGIAFKLAPEQTAGVHINRDQLLLGTQPNSVSLYSGREDCDFIQFPNIDDIHDVCIHDSHCYAVGTSNNEVLKFDLMGKLLQRWKYSEIEDSFHVNCLTVWNGRMVFSAFGEFPEHRGYKGKTSGQGFIQDLEGGRKLIRGLSQPHSPTPLGNNLLVANSEKKEISEYDKKGRLVRSKIFDGYTRGICVSDEIIYIGISCSRNIDQQNSDSAQIIAINSSSWEEISRISIPSPEIYSIIKINDTDNIAKLLARLASHSIRNLSEKNHPLRATKEIEGAQYREELDAAKTTIDSMRATMSWRITAPLRFLSTLRKKKTGGFMDQWFKTRRRLNAFRSVLKQKSPALSFIAENIGRPAFKLLDKIIRKIGFKFSKFRGDIHPDESRLFRYQQTSIETYLPKVTVIVPNYNHEAFLQKRLDSVYGQSYPNFEVILMDDCSTDESRKILNEYASRHADKTKCVLNEINSGGVFFQWAKGIEQASGELIWIAESDDWCSENFLAELVGYFRDESVNLAYCRSVFVNGNKESDQVWTIEEYLADLDQTLWKSSFVDTAHNLVNRHWAVKNIIPNVSSALFRRPKTFELNKDEEWMGMRVCGDWIFYLTQARGGMVAYSSNATNYYRQHARNTSVTTHSKDIYYHEHEMVSRYINRLYNVNHSVFNKQLSGLKEHWTNNRTEPVTELTSRCYSLERIKAESTLRKPNLLMAGYAFSAGGGETFPIQLANLFKEDGYSVTFISCDQLEREPGVRNMLRADIPVVSNFYMLEDIVSDFGIEIIHSHHAWVDHTILDILPKKSPCQLVFSMHGMYEAMDPKDSKMLLPRMCSRAGKLVFAADKNLKPFRENGCHDSAKLVKIENALEIIPVNPADLSHYGIEPDAFVLCNVSRAIPTKGWEEAIETVKEARKLCERKIHLLLIGEGPEYERLKNCSPEYIHFLGFKNNIRDYFAASDLGYLPTRFPGESFPLVLIDCLHAGRAVLATNIGEIAEMLNADETGAKAGSVFDLENGTIPISSVAEIIAKYATDDSFFCESRARVPVTAEKFCPKALRNKYATVYQDLFHCVPKA